MIARTTPMIARTTPMIARTARRTGRGARVRDRAAGAMAWGGAGWQGHRCHHGQCTDEDPEGLAHSSNSFLDADDALRRCLMV